ncbi:MAG TPA: cellulase family glycosylhydrolase, partial [Thermomicrobiaceae bacterium]|nr:cellulase family glycosylhydrolase [Thermomicrobiaceae bacterium]
MGQPVKHVRNRPRSRRFLPGWLSLLFIVGLLLPSSAMAATANSASPSQSTYFSQTGYWVSDPFLTFWRQHGGLTAFGYPISRVFYQDGLLVQYFERARLERHDNLAKTPYGVMATRLGVLLTLGQTNEPAFQPVNAASDKDCQFFSQTGHRLCNGFRVYWEQHGGLAAFGYPISEEFSQNGLTVQYFERARFEWHPENRGTPYEFLLGQLGKEELAGRPVPAEATTPENPDAPAPPAIGPQPLYDHPVTCGWNTFWYGDGSNPSLNQHNLNMAKASGCGWIRIQAQWSVLEPKAGQMNFLPLDPFINAARADGLQILVMVNHAPGWSVANQKPGVPASPDAFADLMGAMASYFKGRVAAWQLWNEPNLIYEVGPLVDPAGYLAMLRAASPRIRAADPNALIVLAGLAPTSLTDPKFAYSDTLYLEKLLALNHGEVRNYIDVVGIHSYGAGNSPDTYFPSNLAQTPAWNNAPEFYFRHAEAIHEILVEAGFGNFPVWITEFGW